MCSCSDSPPLHFRGVVLLFPPRGMVLANSRPTAQSGFTSSGETRGRPTLVLQVAREHRLDRPQLLPQCCGPGCCSQSLNLSFYQLGQLLLPPYGRKETKATLPDPGSYGWLHQTTALLGRTRGELAAASTRTVPVGLSLVLGLGITGGE